MKQKQILKKATAVDTSNLEAKSNLTSSRVEVEKRGIDKFKTVPADLNQLINVVDNVV